MAAPVSGSRRTRALALACKRPCGCRPRKRVPFVGSMRYSALEVHEGREQGPSTDIQSVIMASLMVALGCADFDERNECFTHENRLRSSHLDSSIRSN